MILSVIDKLLIAFIYVNVLFPRQPVVPGIPVSHLLVVLLLFVYGLHAMIDRSRLPRRALFYIVTCFAGILGLGIIGLMLGNPLETVREFIKPTLILILIPIVYALLGRYRPQRYLTHLLLAVFLLASYIIYLYWQCAMLDNRELAYKLTYDTPDSMIAISYLESTIRISLVVGGFLPGGLLLASYGLAATNRWYYYAAFGAIAFALYVSQTWGLWLAGAFACAVSLVFVRRFEASRARPFGYRRWIVAAIMIGCAAVVVYNVSDKLMDAKRLSVSQKSRQTRQALDLFAENPVFGGGLGYVYQSSSFDSVSGFENMMLESSYPMILSSTGLVGAAFYAFIFLYYVFRCVGIGLLRPDQHLFLTAHLSLLVAGIGNPYIWSGGMGLFYMCFLAASVERTAIRI